MTSPADVALILGITRRVRSLRDLDGVVSRGLTKQSVTRVVARVARTRAEARTIRDRVVPSATWKRTTGRLSTHASERTERLARVLAAAEFAWGDAESARAWLYQPHPELGGATPLAASATELGARAVEDVLEKLFYGLPV